MTNIWNRKEIIGTHKIAEATDKIFLKFTFLLASFLTMGKKMFISISGRIISYIKKLARRKRQLRKSQRPFFLIRKWLRRNNDKDQNKKELVAVSCMTIEKITVVENTGVSPKTIDNIPKTLPVYFSKTEAVISSDPVQNIRFMRM